MSTSIYNAYRLRSRNYGDIDQAIKELRIELKELALSICVKDLARRACSYLDNCCLGEIKPKDTQSPVSFALNEFFEEVEETVNKQKRNPCSDVSFDMALMLHEEQFYVMLFTEYNEFIRAFEEKIPCDEYSYYDSSDGQLKYLTMEQWEGRRETWDKILANTSVPAMNGSSFTIVQPIRYIPKEWQVRIREFIPDFESRVKKHGLERAIKTLIEQRDSWPKEGAPAHKFLHAYSDAREDILDGLEEENPEMVSLVANAKEEVSGILIRDPGEAIYNSCR